MKTWNIHTSDGHYVGQCEAKSAAKALLMCLELSGGSISEREIKTRESPDGSTRVSYHGIEYILTTTPTSPFGIS